MTRKSAKIQTKLDIFYNFFSKTTLLFTKNGTKFCPDFGVFQILDIRFSDIHFIFISENDSGPEPLIMLVPQICFLTGLTDAHRKDFKVSCSLVSGYFFFSSNLFLLSTLPLYDGASLTKWVNSFYFHLGILAVDALLCKSS